MPSDDAEYYDSSSKVRWSAVAGRDLVATGRDNLQAEVSLAVRLRVALKRGLSEEGNIEGHIYRTTYLSIYQ